MENRLYTTKEISKMLNVRVSVVRRKFEKYHIKPFKIEKNQILKRYYYTINQISFVFDLKFDIFISIPKKERKPYFEFSEITLKSKINGTN